MLEADMTIIVAVDAQGGFGKDGKIPWDCPEDFRHFVELSKSVGAGVMGRRTYDDLVQMRIERGATLDEIKERGVLPDRITYVVTSSSDGFPGAIPVKDLRAARTKAKEAGYNRIAVLGGERLYNQAFAAAKDIHLTVFNKVYGCDVFFPVNKLDGSRYCITDVKKLGGELNPIVLTYSS